MRTLVLCCVLAVVAGCGGGSKRAAEAVPDAAAVDSLQVSPDTTVEVR